jgi:hypothetical protein
LNAGGGGGVGFGAGGAGAVAVGAAVTAGFGGASTGFTAGRGGAAAIAACSAARCWIAFSTSPGFDTCDQSIFGFVSATGCLDAALALPVPLRRKRTRTRSASSNSSELECVFFSVTPTSSSTSRICLLFTSSSRARSFIRTLLIRPFCFPCSYVLSDSFQPRLHAQNALTSLSLKTLPMGRSQAAS